MRPTVSAIAEKMYEGLLPLAYDDEANDWALLHFCEAYIGSLQLVEDLVRDTDEGPGWSVVLDVDRAPYYGLPWLGQFVGVTTPDKMVGETTPAHDARVRAYIADTGGFRRGTPQSIIGAVAQYLTGSKEVVLFERDTSEYHFAIASRFSETPVEEWPTTNLLINGGFETNATGWGNQGNSTIVRSSNQAHSGVWSLKVDLLDGAATWILSATSPISGATAGRKFTSSAWIWTPPSFAGKQIAIYVRESGGAQAFAETSTTFIAIGGWQRITHTKTIVENDRTGVTLQIASIGFWAGESWYIDDAQIEEYDVATPYVHTDGATAFRAAGMGNVLRAIDDAKPAGLQYVYSVVTDWTYDDLDAAAATYNALEALFTDYNDMEESP